MDVVRNSVVREKARGENGDVISDNQIPGTGDPKYPSSLRVKHAPGR